MWIDRWNGRQEKRRTSGMTRRQLNTFIENLDESITGHCEHRCRFVQFLIDDEREEKEG